MVDESQYCIVSGTWGNHLFIALQPVIHSDIFMCSRYAIDGWYLHLEGNPSAAGNLEWYLRNFCHHELNDGKPTAATYLKCDALYQESEPENGLLFMPFVNGSHLCLMQAARFWESSLDISVVMSCERSMNPLPSLIETSWKRMRRFTSKIESIRLTGGMARNRALVQLFSDCFQLPISIPAGSEQGALGAAIIASVSIGDHPSLVEAARSMTQLSEPYQPKASVRGTWKINTNPIQWPSKECCQSGTPLR